MYKPDWPLPPGVHAAVSTRHGGVSYGRYASFNLSHMVGDEEEALAENRMRFAFGLPSEPVCAWLTQAHSNKVVEAWAAVRRGKPIEADASWTGYPKVACVVLTADCVPVLMAADDGGAVAAAHAGWRGLANGVIAAAAAKFAPGRFSAFLGPCIGKDVYQVGEEVKLRLEAAGAGPSDFVADGAAKFLVDLAAIARRQLLDCGARAVHQSGVCTYADDKRFFSARRDGRASGRFASAIWMSQTPQPQLGKKTNGNSRPAPVKAVRSRRKISRVR